MALPTALPALPFNPARLRSYLLRLPLFTRAVLLVIIAFWLLELQSVWSVVTWGALIPDEMSIGSMYRLNTYPVIHSSFFHALLNTLALTPLLERFEAEHGTLTAVALFVGPLSTFPGGLYILVEKFILHSNTAVVGASVWVFLLLGSEAIRTFRANPYLQLSGIKIPTWTTPLFVSFVVAVLLSNTSFLGHICGILIGYLFGLGYLKVFVPPEKVVRWIEGKLNLLGRLPHYVSVDQKKQGRYGILPTTSSNNEPAVAMSNYIGTSQRLGPLCSSGLVRKLRNDPYLLFARLPSYISFLCVVVGVASLLILPLEEYSRKTYISENALLPGQVHTYFAGSEQNVFRGYKKELEGILSNGDGTATGVAENGTEVSDKVQSIFRAAGLKVATQNYEYSSAGTVHKGQNVYSIIHAPRGDATEAIVLVAAWRTIDGQLNLNGVTLALTLARYFKRWSLWSKDIIFVITPDSKSGTQAWIDAYHDMHPASVQPLPLKSGALQGALVMEYPFDHRFESLHIVYDGVNGQLPNLDLINTASAIAGGQMGIGTSLQEMWEHDNSYEKRLETMLRGMAKQGLGLAAGAHSSFIPYHIDAITLQTKGDGWQDEMALGRTIESLCRSLNNLLEHLHQSFFFYLLMHTSRFVSIGTYMPSAMLIAANFTIMAVALWLITGYSKAISVLSATQALEEKKEKKTASVQGSSTTTADRAENAVSERNLSVPLTVVTALHFLGVVPLYILNSISSQHFLPATYLILFSTILLPILLSAALCSLLTPAPQTFLLIKSFSLLLLGLFLSVLATLNFSLSFFVGLICAPLSFTGPITLNILPAHMNKKALRVALTVISLLLINCLSPPAVLLSTCWYMQIPVQDVLTQAAFGWNVWGLWTPVVVWCVWWPAWLAGALLIASSLFV
ncbi:Gaa1-like protein [Talaromyces proteolyticus]|uniref:Gaa1-like protein n=1 Tax=Talaromyces proteolyticus TaxID=1131652 RepID=A0AAD4KWP3_9EURO|nr:Gaa1-like protein [Talaromyces proteolyticus]KAH8701695.1 Gaa1-like protein [Talaromyces proteolyticus]